jgi:predicted nucleic acid-binding Zn ribbon protein
MTEQDMISRTEARLMTHEQVCAERYANIDESLSKGDKRMTKIEYLIYAVMAIVLLGPGVGAEFFKKLIGI